MEEPQALQIDGEERGDEFYEKIEAPKFVDFTAPDQCRPDDRYWFCLRVGCDQKHEEEIDPEAVYKDFVLRVMAARSPNIRFRKALNRKASSANVKCPLTAPPKSSKSRIPRLALVSSISIKSFDGKLKTRLTQKPSATPHSKARKPDAAKALTTPRNRKRLSNPNAFRSVRNPKATTIAVPKNRVVAKALVFNSPKKAVKKRTSSEVDTPVRTICEAMKKLEITSSKKPVDASRKQLRGREVKSRVFDSLHSRGRNMKEAKSSRCLKRKNDEKDTKPSCDRISHDGDDSSDMEIDDKSRTGSFEGCSTASTSRSGEVNGHEEILETVKTNQSEQRSLEVSSDASSSEERDSGENDAPKSNAPSALAEGTSEGSDQDEKRVSSSGKEKISEVKDSDDKSNALACEAIDNDNEAIDNNEKENALGPDDNRIQHHNNGNHGNILVGKQENLKILNKVNRVIGKTLKEGSVPAASGAQGLKYRKPRPTNPKPFRLRTDERMILKEANSEKKFLTPLKEITTGPRLQAGSSQRKHQTASQKNERCRRKSENESDTSEGGEKKLNRTTLEDQSIGTGSSCLKPSKGQGERKLSSMTPFRRKISTPQKPNLMTSPMDHTGSAQKLQSSLKKIKSPTAQQKFMRATGAISSRKETVSFKTPRKLSVIKETSSKILTDKKVAMPSKNATQGTKASPHTASRSLSRGRRPTTVPKEPHFHSINVPKSCTKKLA